MHRLLAGYAVNYNRRHHRHGHLFQNRYKSILCQEEPYLLELVRYIHLNPLRAQIVTHLEELDHYRYSGHSALMGKRKRDRQDTDKVLALFANRPSPARSGYRQFVEEGIEMGRRPELTGVYAELGIDPTMPTSELCRVAAPGLSVCAQDEAKDRPWEQMTRHSIRRFKAP